MPVLRCTAFAGHRRIAAGNLAGVAAAVKIHLERGEDAPILVFSDPSSEPVELDLRGSVAEVRARYHRPPLEAPVLRAPPTEASPRTPGRPKLGVVAREVTLLPRHWEWLAGQPGGAAVALRKLAEEARRANGERDRARGAQAAAYRFIAAIGGNLPNYDEATRALFAGDRGAFDSQTAAWPPDVREHALLLATEAFSLPQNETREPAAQARADREGTASA